MDDSSATAATASADPQQEEKERAARAEIEVALAAGVRRFYEIARDDDLLGPIFAKAIHDWDAHMRTMTDFWSRVLLGTERYTGTPLPPHVGYGIADAHFERWLKYWKAAADETMPPRLAEHVSAVAGNMSHCWARALTSVEAQLAAAKTGDAAKAGEAAKSATPAA